MVQSNTVSITPATHADRHSVGGEDPLVNPLLLHASRHEAGGDDEISVTSDLIVSDTIAYSGAAPSSSTTLDLSSIVGAHRCICFCKVDAATDKSFCFLPTGTAQADTLYHGLGRIRTINGNDDMVVIITNTDGTCKWDSMDTSNVVLTVIAYMRL